MHKTNILDIYRSPQNVFTAKDIALIWRLTNLNILKDRINYYVKTKKLRQVRRGIYVKDNYDTLELANKIYTPSYVSLETALVKEGVIFQYYESISVISYLSREIEVSGLKYIFHKIKNTVLTNATGIIKKNNYFIAGKERAFLDMIYLYQDYYFDNLRSLNWKKCRNLVSIYQNKKLNKRLESYYKLFKDA